MSNFLIFKAAFDNSATPAIGTYTAEGAAAQFNRNTSISPDYYLYGDTFRSAIRWFVPTAETTDFEFVADILTTEFNGFFTYFIIADSTGTTRLRMWSLNNFIYFANDDSTAQTGTQYIDALSNDDIGGFEVFHRFRVRVRKLTASSSSVEIYVDGTLKLTATAGAVLITCAKIGFMGGVNDSVPLGTSTGIQNAYLYDLSGGDVIDRGVLSGVFNRFISWMKSKFALKSDIPTVNNAALTIKENGTKVATFTANQSTNATANITVPTKTSDLNNDSGYITGVAWNDVTNKPSFATVATSGSYNDLSNKPTIPTVNNATLTIQKNGTTVDTFTANSSSDKTVNITVPTDTNQLANSAGYITADYAVPRSGGAVISGNGFFKTTNNDYYRFGGGTSPTDGAWISACGAAWSDAGLLFFRPNNGSGYSTMRLYPDGTWTWDGTACQITSDQRYKQQITEIDDKLLDAWSDVDLVQFKYNDAVNEKGDKARLHTGFVVQQIDSACKKHGVDISTYGLYCHEVYPEETEEVEIEQADGTKVKEKRVIREASEHYSLRYTEALIVECKYLRRCVERLTARIEELEKGNNIK